MEPTNDLFKNLLIVWGPLILLIGIIGKWGINKVLSPKLYKTDGTPIYVPKDECKDERNHCTANVCKKMDTVDKTTREIKESVDKMEEKRDKARSQLVMQIQGLSNTVHSLEGRFDQYVKDNK